MPMPINPPGPPNPMEEYAGIGRAYDPEMLARVREQKKKHEAEQEAQRQQRLADQGGPMERYGVTRPAMGGFGTIETVERRPKGMTPLDMLPQGGQAPQQGGLNFGPMQFMKNRNAAVAQMQQGLQGKYRPKTFEEQMEEAAFAEKGRQFDASQQFQQKQHGDRMDMEGQKLGLDRELGQGRLDLGREELADQGIRHAMDVGSKMKAIQAGDERQVRDHVAQIHLEKMRQDGRAGQAATRQAGLPAMSQVKQLERIEKEIAATDKDWETAEEGSEDELFAAERRRKLAAMRQRLFDQMYPDEPME